MSIYFLFRNIFLVKGAGSEYLYLVIVMVMVSDRVISLSVIGMVVL